SRRRWADTPGRRTSRATYGVLAAALFGAVAIAAPACGGDDKKVEYPKVEGDGGGVEAGATLSTDTGQQVGVTGGGPDAHADVSGGAKGAYDKAFQAWMRGDLDAAKAGFQE